MTASHVTSIKSNSQYKSSTAAFTRMTKWSINNTRPQRYKNLFSNSTQLSMKFQLLIRTKILKIKGFLLSNPQLLFLSCLKMFKCQQLLAFNIYEHEKLYAQLSWARKKFYNLGARFHYPSICMTYTIPDMELSIESVTKQGNFHKRWEVK